MGAGQSLSYDGDISAATVADWSRKLQHCCPKSRSRRRNLLGTQQRVTANADVRNKDRTYLKALAVKRRAVLCRAPSSMIDFSIRGGLRRIPILQSGGDEVATMTGRTADGRMETIRVVSEGSPVANYGFDVTPARLVTGLITERGVVKPKREALARAFPERAGKR
jgi:methylthioribose-1-phosphate isomerase